MSWPATQLAVEQLHESHRDELHAKTLVEPEVDVVVPPGQLVQPAEAIEAAYDPAGHVEQLDASARAYEPALQAVQPRAAVDPAFVTVPANPGAQIVHAETDVLPRSEPAVEMPVGQAVQLVAPSAA